MEQLNYRVLKESGYKGYILEAGAEKIMQFGEGNFLRAFADDFIDIANERVGYNGKAVLVQPIAQGLTDLINQQEGLYTLYLRGSENGRKVDERRVISCVSRCINPYGDWEKVLELARSEALETVISNTTEAGIAYDPESRYDQVPPASFPAKLTRVLHERWKAGREGLVILSCELIDNNGKELLRCVNRYIDDWGLEADFRSWVNGKNLFCSTLVDRIVPGRIRDPEEAKALAEKNGYEDPLTDVGEVFGIWVIEGPQELEDRLPFKKAGVPVIVVPDVTPYKKRKVRILNGAHTGFVLGAYLAGFDIVRDCMHDDTVREFMNRMLYEEVIPTLPLDRKDLEEFARAVQDRFNNPFVNHELMSISLNSTSKWRARNMPSFLEYYEAKKELPACLTTSLAACIAFYSSDIQELGDQGLVCRRPKGNTYTVSDDREVLEFYWAHRADSEEALVHAVLTNEKMWGQDLTEVSGLEQKVAGQLKMIRRDGALAAFRSCL
ncbi:MAG: tagaturonate reductase [Clostridia bacterium]|nr:tagaturonate reductase [Clostridia bacterium]